MSRGTPQERERLKKYEPYSVLVTQTEENAFVAKLGITGDILYGPDGDAAAVIQSAIDASENGLVYLNQANYEIGTKLYGRGNMTIRGAGPATVLRLKDGVSNTLLEISNKVGVVVRDLTLDCNKANQTLGNAIVLDSVDHVWLSRLWIKDAKQEGIYAYPMATSYCGVINIDRCFISGCGDAGIWLNGVDSHIRGCDIGQNAYGIVLEGWSNHLEGNKIWGNTYYGLYVKESYHNRVIGNRIDFNKRHGIYCEDGVKELITALNHIYMNSQEAANTYDGIHVYGSASKPTDHILIRSNRIGTSYLYDTTPETQRNNIDIEGKSYTTNVTILMNDLLNYRNKSLWFDGDPSTALIKYNKGYKTENSGTATFSGNGTQTQFIIPHGLAWYPTSAVVTAGSSDARGDFYVTYDTVNLTITYAVAPPSGTNNVVLRWYAEM